MDGSQVATTMHAESTTTPRQELNSPELRRRINALRTIDNRTNWLYLAREYFVLGSIVALAIAFFENRAGWGLGRAWDVPVGVLAVLMVGACQHRLTTLGHEASHYMLFRNRRLNELASDWLCMFPVFSTTHGYRIQHLAHHQHVNHPELDPDVLQMEASGHRFRFPMARALFVWKCVIRQLLWPPGLIRYILSRARYASVDGADGPYAARGPRSLLPAVVAIAYLAALYAFLKLVAPHHGPWTLALVPLGLWLPALLFFATAPERFFAKSALRPDVPTRWTLLMRASHFSLVLLAIAWVKQLTGFSLSAYYWLLWVLPLLTAFPFLMLMRQVVQHGNADQGRLTNTRIFHVGPLIRFAVFPLGMDYHLPHHLFPMVPHYRLRALHALLAEADAYRERATVVEGYFFPRTADPPRPTVLDLMAQPGA
jgi:fatty acid desaturase